MRRQRRSRGSALVWTVVVIAVLLGFAGLSCDTAYVVFCEQQLQTAADASALAGAETLRSNPNGVVAQAQLVASQNKVGGTPLTLQNGDVLLGHYGLPTDATPGFVANAQPYNAVQVSAKRTTGSAGGALPLIFGQAFGVKTLDVARTATAVVSVTPAQAVVLDPTGSAALSMTMTSGGSLNIAGAVAVNSNSSSAAVLTGSGTLNVTSMQVGGDYQVTGQWSLPTVKTGVPPTADPLASLPAPTPGTLGVKVGSVLSPGYYPSGILLSGSTNYVLQPGLYIVDGSGFAYTGSGTVVGSGVTIYLTDSAGGLRLVGSGGVDLIPPTTGTYAGITVFQGRGNGNPSQISGTGGLNVSGTIYMPKGQLSLTGSGPSYANALIVWRLALTGSGFITLPTVTTAASGAPVLMQ